MWKFVDLGAIFFVPPEIRKDPDRRRSAMRYRATARIFILIIFVFFVGNSTLLLLVYPDYATVIFLSNAAMCCNALALVLMRLFRTFLVPLLIANIGSVVSFISAATISGGLASPTIFLLLTIPALSISFGDRKIFRSACITIAATIVGLFAAELWGLIPPHTPLKAHQNFQFIVLMSGFSLMGLGGVAAQLSIDQSRGVARRATNLLAEKNEMLEKLSGKLAKYLSPQVYSSIFEGRQDVKVGAVRKKLTVFFSDIASFTEITDQLESEELTALLNRYLTEMSNIALEHGATIDKFIGDAIVVYFGDPESRGVKEDAATCVRMAIAMQKRMADLKDEWLDLGLERTFELRIGINTGYCTVGNFGSEDRMDYTIIGSEVNLAARLESAADVGGILLANETYSLVKSWVDAEEGEAFTVKGFSRPIRTFRVKEIQDDLGRKENLIQRDIGGLSITIDRKRLNRAEGIKELEEALTQLKEDS